MADSKSFTFELNESVLTAQVGRLDEMAMVVEQRFSELKMTIEDVGNADPGSKISESLGGLQSGLGTISSAFGQLGSSSEAITSGFGTAVGSVGGITDAFKNLGSSVQNGTLFSSLATGIGGMSTMLGGVSGGVQGITNLASGFMELKNHLGGLMSSIGGVGGIMGKLTSPMGLVIIGIVALVAAFTYLMTTNESFRNTVMSVVTQVAQLFGNLSLV